MTHNERENYLNKEMKERLDYFLETETEHEFVAMFLYGSQNYGVDVYTDEYQSDVDVKVLVMPTLAELVSGKKPVSKLMLYKDGSHLEVKDVRLVTSLLTKANPAYLELLFTNFKLVNPKYTRYVDTLYLYREKVVSSNLKNLVNASFGMVKQKEKHLYDTEDGSYDPKQLHHMVRLGAMMAMYLDEGKSFGDSLTLRHNEEFRNVLKMVKTGELPFDKEKLALEMLALEKTKNYCFDLVRESVQDKDFNVKLEELTNDLVESYLLTVSAPNRLEELSEKAKQLQMVAGYYRFVGQVGTKSKQDAADFLETLDTMVRNNDECKINDVKAFVFERDDYANHPEIIGNHVNEMGQMISVIRHWEVN